MNASTPRPRTPRSRARPPGAKSLITGGAHTSTKACGSGEQFVEQRVVASARHDHLHRSGWRSVEAVSPGLFRLLARHLS